MSLDPKTSKKDKKKVSSKAYHPEMHYPLIAVAEMSIEKGYEPLNWLDPNSKVTMTYLIDAAQRHLDKIKLGIDFNTEEKTPLGNKCKNQPYEAACVAYNMLLLCMQMEKNVAIDDRQFKNNLIKSVNTPKLKGVTVGKQEDWEDINDYLEGLDTTYKSQSNSDIQLTYKLDRRICNRCNDFVFSFHHHQLCLAKGK